MFPARQTVANKPYNKSPADKTAQSGIRRHSAFAVASLDSSRLLQRRVTVQNVMEPALMGHVLKQNHQDL